MANDESEQFAREYVSWFWAEDWNSDEDALYDAFVSAEAPKEKATPQ